MHGYWTAATEAALGDPAAKRALNERLFTVIAPRYDFVTRALSFGRDGAWKRTLVGWLPAVAAPTCVDLACGTGDLAAQLAARYPGGRVVGVDVTEAMLDLARVRQAGAGVEFRRGDMAALDLPAGSVDVVTGGYALRNAGSLPAALAEVHRVLRPGGVAVFLDFSKPVCRLGQRVVLALLAGWGGLWGWLLHGDPGVYAYIAHSLRRFPDRRALAALLRAHGLPVIQSRRCCGGMIEIVQVQRV